MLIRRIQLHAMDAIPTTDEPLKGIRFWQWCDPFGVCVEERYDEWLTLWYDTPEAAVPKDFTAWED